MKKFAFPLDRVLAWRRIELDREQATLQRLLAERNVLAAKEASLRAQRNNAERAVSTNRFMESEHVWTMPDWQDLMKRTIAALAVERIGSDKKVAEQQARFLEAKRRVGLLERLREKRVDTWQADLSREEETFAAEAYLALRNKRN